MISIVLVEPEIPENTGNIARTCAAAGMPLYLIRPLGFEITEARVKRAGLDYWDKVNVKEIDNLAELMDSRGREKFFFLSSKAKKAYSDAEFPPDAYLVFGKETKGLPPELIAENAARALRIPMRPTLRCLNLANSVAIVAYEALRQHSFFGMK